MSIISSIRKNSWVLIVVIGFALAAFILMDMTSQGGQFGGNQTTMGKVNGVKLDYNVFSRNEQLLYNGTTNDPYANRSSLWNTWVNQTLVSQEAEKLGLGVSRTELMDLQFGPTPSGIISQRFMDPTTGQLNRTRLNEIKTSIETGTFTDPNMRGYWKYQEQEIRTQRLQDKIRGMVSQGLFIPTWQAEMANKDQNDKVTFEYVKVPFDEIDNTDVSISDSDLKSFLSENEEQYKTEDPTRKVEYLVFDVVPSGADSASWLEELEGLMVGLDTTTQDSLYITQNRGTYDAAYLKADVLSGVAADTLKNMNAGDVYGPYMENGAYKLAKVIDRKIIPDSVRSRHILRPATTQEEFFRANAVIDSLKEVIESGANTFDALAAQFGTDGTASKGGDLDFAGPGTMVKPFNDLIFFKAEPGILYKVVTQFGIHLVEVTDRRYINNEEGFKIGYLTQSIIPTDATQRMVRAEAMAFLSNNRTLDAMRQAATELGKETVVSSALLENDFNVGVLGGGQSSRDMVRWAFGARVNEVSPNLYDYRDAVEYFDNKYVVAAVRSTQSAGVPSVADIRSDIELAVINKKKGELLAEKMKNKDLAAVASEFDSQLDTASNVSFSSSFVPQIGSEPELIGEAFKISAGTVSSPIVGSTGVFVFKVIDKTAAGPVADISSIRRTVGSQKRAQITSTLINGLRENAKIEDNRSTFY